MNIKRIFGTLLTLAGVFLLVYAAYLFANAGGGWRQEIVYAVLGAVFFISGIGLVKTVKDEPQGPAA